MFSNDGTSQEMDVDKFSKLGGGEGGETKDTSGSTGGKASYKAIVLEQSFPECPPLETFNGVFCREKGSERPTTDGHRQDVDGLEGVPSSGGGVGKSPPHQPRTHSLSMNEDMVKAIYKE